MIAKNVELNISFDMINTDGSENTAATPTVQVRTDAGSYATSTNSASRVGSTGTFDLTLAQAEMDGDKICVKVSGTGCLTRVYYFYTESVWTSTKAGYVDSNISSVDSDVWSFSGTRALSTYGTLIADIWAYGSRTLSSGLITVAQIWDHLLTSISTSGSIGKLIKDYLDASVSSRLASAGYTTPPTVTQIRQELDSNSTKLLSIEADTNEIQQELADGGRTDTLIDTIITHLEQIKGDGWTAESLRVLWGYVHLLTFNGQNEVLATFDTSGLAAQATVDDIKAKTDNLPANPASASDIPTVSQITNDILDEQNDLHLGEGTIGAVIDFIRSIAARFTFSGNPEKVDANATADVDESAIADAVVVALRTQSITVTNPVLAANKIAIIRGVDYVAETQQIRLDIENYADLTGADVVFNCGLASAIICTFENAGQTTQTIIAELTAAQTSAMGIGSRDFSIVHNIPDGENTLKWAIAEGTLIIKKVAGL